MTSSDLLQSVFDAIPSMLLIVDNDVRIQEYNTAAAVLLAEKSDNVLNNRTGDILKCLNATKAPGGCGTGTECGHCGIRQSVNEAYQGKRILRRRVKLEMVRRNFISEAFVLITASPFHFNGRQLVLLVIEDITDIAELQRMIPICSVCKKIRDEKEIWSRVESYFMNQWGFEFSHSLCPECLKKEMKKFDIP